MLSFVSPLFSEGLSTSPDSVSNHLLTVNTSRFLSDYPSFLPGMWMRDFGSLNVGPWYRYRGSELNEIDMSIDGVLLREPLNHQIDMNLLPWGDITALSMSTPFNGTGEALELQTRPMESKKPLSKFIYQNILFRPETRSNQTYFDVFYQQQIRSNLTFSFGASSTKYANDFPDSVLADTQIRARLQWKPFSNLSLSYRLLDNGLSHNFIHPVRFSADTFSTNTRHLDQDRTDHILTVQHDWNNFSTRLSYAYSRHAFSLKDRYSPQNETTHVYSNGLHLSQSLQTAPARIRWGVYHTDDRADFFNPETTIDQHENLFYTNLHAPFLKRLALDADLKHYANSFDESDFLYNARLTANISDQLRLFLGHQKNLRPATLGERTGRTITPYPPDHLSEYDAILNRLIIHSNHSLRSESSGILQTGFNYHTARLTCETTAYLKNCKDVIAINTDHPDSLFYDHIEEKKIAGIEGQITVPLPFHLQLSSVCNYFKGHDRGKNDLLEPPDLWGSASLAWGGVFFQKDLEAWISLTWQFNSQYYLVEIIGDEMGLVSVDDHRFLNAKADLLFMQRARFSFSFENILNQQLMLANYPLPLRTFRMGIEWELFN